MANSFICSRCGVDFHNPLEISRHYKKNPSHMSERVRKSKEYREKAKAKAKKVTAVAGSIEIDQPGEAFSPKNVRFCPCCGVNIERISMAVAMSERLEQ